MLNHILDLIAARILAWGTGGKLYRIYDDTWAFRIEDVFGVGKTPRRAVHDFVSQGGQLETAAQRAKNRTRARGSI